jgi:hypothetical protein
MLNLFWEWHQQAQIHEAESSANSARREVSSQAGRVRDLELQLARVTLVSQALWELLRERVGLTEEQLLAKVNEVDIRDGSLDGKLSAQVVTCPRCQRNVHARHFRCIYCGQEITKEHVFQ